MRLLLTAMLALACALLLISNANAHGKHISPIEPAYDCYYNPDGPDTRGDLVITHDFDLAVFVVWKCVCVHTPQTGFVCYWKHMGQYVWKKRATERMRELEDRRYNGEILKVIHVQWVAFHKNIGCVQHHDYRYAVVARRAG